jgi:hypothetical protein
MDIDAVPLISDDGGLVAMDIEGGGMQNVVDDAEDLMQLHAVDQVSNRVSPAPAIFLTFLKRRTSLRAAGNRSQIRSAMP